jgi:uncharacterized protein (DUF2267 family)
MMNFRELVKKVKQYSGLSDEESIDALELMVESLAVRLDESDRMYMASRLPEPLDAITLSVWPSEENNSVSILDQFMELLHVDENRAKQEIMSAWKALKDAVSPSAIKHIQSHLPSSASGILN